MAPTPMIGLRVKPDDLERIDELARARKLNRTQYMLQAALNPAGEPDGVQEQLDELRRRVVALEQR